MSLNIALFDDDYVTDSEIFGFNEVGFQELIDLGFLRIPYKQQLIGQEKDGTMLVGDRIDLEVHRKRVRRLFESLKIGTLDNKEAMLHSIDTRRYLCVV